MNGEEQAKNKQPLSLSRKHVEKSLNNGSETGSVKSAGTRTTS
jgi:hypothetical protein